MRIAFTSLFALSLAACADAGPGPQILINHLDHPICTLQVSDCGCDDAVELVSPDDPLGPGEIVDLPDRDCLDLFVVSCDGSYIGVIALRDGWERPLSDEGPMASR